MKVKTFLSSSVEGIAQAISHFALEGFNPNLAIVFGSSRFDMAAISALFDSLDIDVVGASTAGEILNESVHEGIITGLLLEVDKNFYAIHSQEYEGANPFSASKKLGAFAQGCFANPAILVMSGGVSIDAEQLVYGLKAGIGHEIPIFGGLAADDLQLNATFAFTRKGATNNGLAILVFDNDKIAVKGLATSGWEGVGMENTITHAEGNIVYEINNEPAINAFIKYFGYFNNGNSSNQVSDISAQYPMQILREDGVSILRAPLMPIEENGALVLAGGVRTGDKFKFSIAPGFEVIDRTIAEFGNWRKEVDNADALVLFSCKGRHAALGPLIEDEVKGIYDFWGKPMVGFFTYGEIGLTKNGVCEFHNETCSLVAISERK